MLSRYIPGRTVEKDTKSCQDSRFIKIKMGKIKRRGEARGEAQHPAAKGQLTTFFLIQILVRF
jgi:hypothetical protein